MKKGIISGIAALVMGLVLWLVLRPRKEGGTDSGTQGISVKDAGNPANVPSSCINPPAQFAKWSLADIGWGAAHQGLQKKMGFTKKDADMYVDDVIGFFKAIGIRPTEAAVQFYKKDIGQWLDNGGGKHWDIKIGGLACG